MADKIYIGIDGGGTKTGFSASDENGNVLVKFNKPTIHAKQVEEEVIRKILNESIDEILEKTNSTKEDIGFTFAGIPGYGEYEDVIILMNKVMEDVLESKNFELGNDSVCGWAGSQAGRPGVNMVLGTGAIAYGMDYEGNSARSSGWGPYCGDEGSAYWIARNAINIFAKESDGRLERGPLYHLIKEKFQFEEDFDFISIIADFNDDRTEIAKISMILSKAAKEGDENAINLIKDVAYEASIAIRACYEKMNFKEDERIFVSFSGGVFNIGSLLTDEIKRLLSDDERIEFMESILEPSEGSILMALKASGIEITEEIVENLKG